MEWETVIGLEVHAQLMTKSKIFSGASTEYGAEPNAQACAIDLGLPGVLPVLNEKAVEMAIRFGLASNSKIANRSVFARKNYFYPDLPKGYQISQFDLPVVHDGHMDIIMSDGTKKRIGITRAHLEEDAGKSLHEDFHGMTGVDLNRAGIALLEIVSEPDMRSAEEAIVYLKTLHTLVKYLGICDGNMQEGSFRCDANVSVRPKGQKEFGTRCEIKNVNSFKFVEQAIEYEVARQIDVIENGGTIRQQTRLYDSVKKETRPMRDKEEANDYRYFPCPDLLPLVIDAKQIDKVMQTMPELPQQKLDRFVKDLGLSTYDAGVITASKALADFYEDVLNKHDSKEFAKLAANWITGELLAALNKHNLNIEESPVSAKQMNQLLQRISDETISGKIAKTLFECLWLKEGDDVDALIESKGLKQVTDTGAIEKVIKDIMAQFPEQLADYRSGKDKLFGFFVGQVMKESKGKANPGQVNDLLKKLLQG